MATDLEAEEFEYDIAFSFLASDEPTAIQINERLRDRVRTFLYSERQGAIAGTNGIESFSRR
jgi:hypothetical protein